MKFIKANYEIHDKNGNKVRGSTVLYINLDNVRRIEVIHNFKFSIVYDKHYETVYSEELQDYLDGRLKYVKIKPSPLSDKELKELAKYDEDFK